MTEQFSIASNLLIGTKIKTEHDWQALHLLLTRICFSF